MASLSDQLGDHVAFLQTLTTRMRAAGINVASLGEIDHLCYRVETEARYQELRERLQEFGPLVSEEMINGRPICIFKLDTPLQYGDRTIAALELPSPSSTPYKEGIEHAEFVVPDLTQFMAAHPQLNFITKDLHQEINPHVAVKFEGIAAKFHIRPILEVVELERLAHQHGK